MPLDDNTQPDSTRHLINRGVALYKPDLTWKTTYGFEFESIGHSSPLLSLTHLEIAKEKDPPEINNTTISQSLTNVTGGTDRKDQIVEAQGALVTDKAGITWLKKLAVEGSEAVVATPAKRFRSGPWQIDTDSGNALELVSPILVFEDKISALEYKMAVLEIIRNAVFYSSNLKELIDALNKGLTKVNTEHKVKRDDKGDDAVDRFKVELELQSYEDLKKHLADYNVDDGNNIQAIQLAAQNFAASHVITTVNEDEIPAATNSRAYLGETEIRSTDKYVDIAQGCQTNIMISLEDYYGWMEVRAKNHQTKLNFIWERNILSGESQYGDLDPNWNKETLERKLKELFWLKFLLLASDITQFTEGENKDNVTGKGITGTADTPKKKHLAYIVMEKILCGALASVSEPVQLALQQAAWRMLSIDALRTPDEAKWLNSSDYRDDAKMSEFHSSLKDLTGCWFKADLLHVIAAEDQIFAYEPFGAIGFRALMEEASEDVERTTGSQFDYNEFLKDPAQVICAMENVEKKLCSKNWMPYTASIAIGELNKIETLGADCVRTADVIEDEGNKNFTFDLKLCEPKNFLGYDNVDAWQPRHDTIKKPFKVAKNAYRYVVERRNR